MKLTKKRAEILDSLKNTKGAVTAKELHQALPHIDLVTIYRALELFVQEKLITRLNLSGAEVQYEYQEEPHHHAVCVDCDRVIHFSIPDKELKRLLPLKDFAIDSVELTIRGACHGGTHS